MFHNPHHNQDVGSRSYSPYLFARSGRSNPSVSAGADYGWSQVEYRYGSGWSARKCNERHVSGRVGSLKSGGDKIIGSKIMQVIMRALRI